MVVVGHDAQHRLLDVLPRQCGLGAVRTCDHRHGHQRDSGDPRIDQRNGDRPYSQHPLQVTRLELEVRGEIARRLDSGVCDRRDHQRVDDVLDARRAEQVQLIGEPVRMKDDDQAHDDHQQLQPKLGQRQHDQADLTVAPGDVRDVEHRGQADHHDRHRQLDVSTAEPARDRRQIVRDRDRRRGDHDQIVDQDRPARDEADQLVEGVPSERRRPTPLPEHRAPLDVGERGEREHQPRDQEDQWRQPQAAIGDHPDREVDREADRGRSRGVEERHPEHRLALISPNRLIRASTSTASPSRGR